MMIGSMLGGELPNNKLGDISHECSLSLSKTTEAVLGP